MNLVHTSKASFSLEVKVFVVEGAGRPRVEIGGELLHYSPLWGCNARCNRDVIHGETALRFDNITALFHFSYVTSIEKGEEKSCSS